MTDPIGDPLDLFRLDGKVALVTGASSGLGERFARVLHAVGGQVAIVARRRERLESLAAELAGALVVVADLSVAADRERAVGEVLAHFGHVDVLVNNAGVGHTVPVEREELDVFRSTMELNVTATWHMAKLVAPGMVTRGSGSIINVASMLGHVASTPVKQANYCASKGAVVNLTRELGAQWGRKGIRVNALCPGWFPSEMTAEMVDDAESQRFVAANSPIPRMGEPHELDAALLFLAGPGSTFMTGQSVVVDGGWTAR